MPKKRGLLHNRIAARGETVQSAHRAIIQPRFWRRVAPRKRLRLTRPGAAFSVQIMRSRASAFASDICVAAICCEGRCYAIQKEEFLFGLVVHFSPSSVEMVGQGSENFKIFQKQPRIKRVMRIRRTPRNARDATSATTKRGPPFSGEPLRCL